MNLIALRETWVMLQRENNCSVDRMLCSPRLRTEFLAAASLVTGCNEEETLLWAVVGLRKNKVLPSLLKQSVPT